MYLVVFVMLVIGLVGIYAQILSLQAARVASSLSALGNNMVQWHVAAVSMAASIVDTYKNDPTLASSVPCSLSLSSLGLSTCPVPKDSGDATGTVTTASNGLNNITVNYDPNTGVGTTVPVHLPPNYNAAHIQFYAVLYQDPTTSQYYVATFLQPPTISSANPSPGYLSLPPNIGALISYTAPDLLHQLSLTQIPVYAYGTARSSQGSSILVTPGLASTELQVTSSSAVRYNLPLSSGSTPVVRTGGVAIVSPVTGL